MNSVFAVSGVSDIHISHNAAQFISCNFYHMCFVIGIQHVTTMPYYPQSSHAQRFNRNLCAALTAYNHHDHCHWDENLGWLQFALNSIHHNSHTHTPFGLIFSFTPKSPLSAMCSINDLLPNNPNSHFTHNPSNITHRNLQLAHDQIHKYCDHHSRSPPFLAESHIWVHNYPLTNAAQNISDKLWTRYKRPFTTAEFTLPVLVWLTDPNGGRNVHAHISQLKKV
jgi:hypothetical protein